MSSTFLFRQTLPGWCFVDHIVDFLGTCICLWGSRQDNLQNSFIQNLMKEKSSSHQVTNQVACRSFKLTIIASAYLATATICNLTQLHVSGFAFSETLPNSNLILSSPSLMELLKVLYWDFFDFLSTNNQFQRKLNEWLNPP